MKHLVLLVALLPLFCLNAQSESKTDEIKNLKARLVTAETALGKANAISASEASNQATNLSHSVHSNATRITAIEHSENSKEHKALEVTNKTTADLTQKAADKAADKADKALKSANKAAEQSDKAAAAATDLWKPLWVIVIGSLTAFLKLHYSQKKTEALVLKVEVNGNGKMDQLIKVTEAEAYARGALDERKKIESARNTGSV